jgi:hypothetical protein
MKRCHLALVSACLLLVLALSATATAKPTSTALLKRDFSLAHQTPNRFASPAEPANIGARLVGHAFDPVAAPSASPVSHVDEHGGQTIAIALAGAALAVALAGGMTAVVRVRRVVNPT